MAEMTVLSGSVAVTPLTVTSSKPVHVNGLEPSHPLELGVVVATVPTTVRNANGDVLAAAIVDGAVESGATLSEESTAVVRSTFVGDMALSCDTALSRGAERCETNHAT
jgi:hypothetical protein